VVQLQNASGEWILEQGQAISKALWEKNRKDAGKRRTWIAQLYPDGMEFDWKVSGRIFHPPKVVEGHFIHSAPCQC
jgi:iron uptake system EfeUOB component EfeO/EfeM